MRTRTAAFVAAGVLTLAACGADPHPGFTGPTVDHPEVWSPTSPALEHDLPYGHGWVALPDHLYVAIFDGRDPRKEDPDFTCVWNPDETTTVRCSDGTVVTS